MPYAPLTTPSEIVSPLLGWYRANARDLPWRKTRDPYRVWVSEIMLQQTRVAAVLGYYQRFLSAFPSVEALADAPEEQLMKLWEGLGYYSRARNLKSAARTVIKDFGGKFPDTYEGLLSLPGVGDYTASAIASASFGRREPAVDGNVLRAFTRLTDCHDDIAAPKTKKAVREQVGPIMPAKPEDIHIFNQAFMELGAMVCVPGGSPKCGSCPLAESCLGRIRGTAESLPVKSPKKARRVEEKTIFLFIKGGKIALRKRPRDGLLAGLWEFPNVNGAMDETAAGEQAALWGLTPGAWNRRLAAKHIFSHVEWHMTGYVLRVSGGGPEDFLWADGPELEKRAIPSAFARFLSEATILLNEKGAKRTF
jgi:A/G-specific adenine glycosylase